MKPSLLPLALLITIFTAGCSVSGELTSTTDQTVETIPSPVVTMPQSTIELTSTPGVEITAETDPPSTLEIEIDTEVSPTPVLTQNQNQCSGVLTSPNQEGPFYSPGSPQRESLIEAGMAGNPVQISGYVYDQECNPLPGIKLEFWLADVNGNYDNTGYKLRGHTFTDERGFYTIESIEPTSYTGRPPHIHVKLFDPQGIEILTSQMYFPGSENSADVSAAPDLLVDYSDLDANGKQQVFFNFTVRN